MDQKMDATIQKVTPSLVGAGYSLTQLPLADIAALMTILYTGFLIFDWLWKKYKAFQEWRNAP